MQLRVTNQQPEEIEPELHGFISNLKFLNNERVFEGANPSIAETVS